MHFKCGLCGRIHDITVYGFDIIAMSRGIIVTLSDITAKTLDIIAMLQR